MDRSKRLPENPIIKPEDVKPSRKDFIVECVFNPGVFKYRDKIGLLCRVAERTEQKEGMLSVPILENNKVKIIEINLRDPELEYKDVRKFRYKEKGYLTTLSHLRIAWSKDGRNFTVEEKAAIYGEGEYETFGVEDCRVNIVEGRYLLTYTAVSENGVCVGLIETENFTDFKRLGIIFPPHNKDCVIFPEKVNGKYYALHRPTGLLLGGNFIWMSSSSDLIHWGNHKCIAKTRENMWDCERIGVNGPPIKTEKGYLILYHGADYNSRYCIGAMLLDPEDPSRVISRTQHPVMEPIQDYEKEGFLGNVVFNNGHIVEGDRLILYYGAADKYICGAEISISEIFNLLGT